MIKVAKEFTFDAAHSIPDHKGACKNIHGHTYKLRVTLSIEDHQLNIETGMVLDFGDLKEEIQNHILSAIDHQHLNKVVNYGFPQENPTAENMVLWVRDVLKEFVTGPYLYITLDSVRLYETPTSYAEWSRK